VRGASGQRGGARGPLCQTPWHRGAGAQAKNCHALVALPSPLCHANTLCPPGPPDRPESAVAPPDSDAAAAGPRGLLSGGRDRIGSTAPWLLHQLAGEGSLIRRGFSKGACFGFPGRRKEDQVAQNPSEPHSRPGAVRGRPTRFRRENHSPQPAGRDSGTQGDQHPVGPLPPSMPGSTPDKVVAEGLKWGTNDVWAVWPLASRLRHDASSCTPQSGEADRAAFSVLG
jgi:hypothetical protein